jgi:hypothetical protein
MITSHNRMQATAGRHISGRSADAAACAPSPATCKFACCDKLQRCPHYAKESLIQVAYTRFYSRIAYTRS